MASMRRVVHVGAVVSVVASAVSVGAALSSRDPGVKDRHYVETVYRQQPGVAAVLPRDLPADYTFDGLSAFGAAANRIVSRTAMFSRGETAVAICMEELSGQFCPEAGIPSLSRTEDGVRIVISIDGGIPSDEGLWSGIPLTTDLSATSWLH